ncbi:MAG: hypothetical protein PHI28_18145 [Mangrovibacterium sp.]|nr:hypothetical protein [Mangrovibacterium sp.]
MFVELYFVIKSFLLDLFSGNIATMQTMRALEFKSKIKNNRILIPAKIQSGLKTQKERNVRVIVLVDDSDVYDDLGFQQTTRDQFLKGYADSDSIYDNY